MIILALDTAMAACSAAVIDTERTTPLAKSWTAMERGHAEAIAPLVENVMREAGLAFATLDRIAVTIGPGTFTGVRIGLALARGFGVALSKPVIGIDTLAAIAANVQGVSSPVLVVADARRDEVYAALFAADGACLKSPAVMSIAMAGRDVPPGTQVIGTATDAVIAASGRTDLTRSKARDLPDAASFARLAARMEPGPMPSPLYLRSPDAKPQMGLRLRSLPIEIRDIADPHIFAQIHGECFDNPWDAKAIADLLAMPGALALTACEGEEPVAFVLARRAADEAEIITIATRPFAQRRGIAARLVADAATRLSQQNVKSLFLEVASANAAARALYGQAGFAERGQRPAYYANGDDAIIMRKDLA